MMCKLKYGGILIMKTSKILGKIGEQLSSDGKVLLAILTSCGAGRKLFGMALRVCVPQESCTEHALGNSL